MTRIGNIHIRPCIIPDVPDMGPRLCIEINGQILPVAKSIEIKGEIINTETGKTLLSEIAQRQHRRKHGKPIFY